MKMILRIAFLALAGLVATVGCQQADRAVSAPPSHAELPTFEALEPTLPALIGVAGAGDAPRVIIVPRYEEIALTPEEREALGEEEPPEPDVLLFYRPPRGPEHGVSPGSFEMLTGSGRMGGALVGHDSVYPRFGTYGVAGRHSSPHVFARPGAMVGRPRAPAGDVGRIWAVEIGQGPPRTGARQAPSTGR